MVRVRKGRVRMNSIEANLKTYLNEKGFKLTFQRQAVLDVIVRHKGKHLSGEEIFELLKLKYPGIGLATVYRTLPLLEKIGLLSTIHLNDDCTRYEYNYDNGQHSHHHLICLGCGSVFEVQDDLLETLEQQVHKKSSFIIKNHSVKFYGYCSKCSQTQ